MNDAKKLLATFFGKHREVLFAYLFGSTVTRTANLLSDIDIALYVDQKKVREKGYPYGYAAHISARIQSLLHREDVDVVILNTAPPLLRYEVIRNGTPIFVRGRRREHDFRFEAVRDYLDTKPLRAVQAASLRRKLFQSIH